MGSCQVASKLCQLVSGLRMIMSGQQKLSMHTWDNIACDGVKVASGRQYRHLQQ